MPPSEPTREFDIVVFGATGFTGRLVAEHLARASRYSNLRWAIAARSADKLRAIADLIDAPSHVALINADTADRPAIDAMVRRTRALISAVGPYQLYGEGVVAACAETGTDYLDLAGESHWIAAMIAAHASKAEASGARLLFSSGFDSIPFDLGVYFLQKKAMGRLGAPLRRVRGRVRSLTGSLSGGTLASGQATMAAAKTSPALRALLGDPFALTPGFVGVAQPNPSKAYFDDVVGSWVGPFMMAPINTKTVHRTNFLLGQVWGSEFQYDEMIMAETEAAAKAAGFDMTQAQRQPGEGPSRQEREQGSYDLLFVGETADGRRLKAAVRGDMDPGYGSTAKILAETAVALLEQAPKDQCPGGAWTPAAAIGDALLERLPERAGLTFAIET